MVAHCYLKMAHLFGAGSGSQMWFSVHEAFILMLLKKMFQGSIDYCTTCTWISLVTGTTHQTVWMFAGEPHKKLEAPLLQACSYHHKDFKCKSWTFGMQKGLKLVISYLKR
ncbi:hypothetical protein C4D60_Mb09t24500 [Musa balbisiana]|uniref:Uncharacterized protein n=1 Tax=Musa balbisiana TaxID=52838 RepID=A0A4S8IIU9_MUSBA|nr:hypothetical protein C4D60_Mb09t24500 [Musa balbisiana]